jgi:hypothetical protein
MKVNLLAALLLLPATACFAVENSVSLPDNVPYYDKTIIQANVLNECTALGSDLSTHIAEALQQKGVTANRVAQLDASQGTTLEVQIVNLISAGNAYFGHRKNMSVRAKIVKDGQTVGENTFTRDSMGGAFGGFKGSCSVLDRVATTLGKDIAAWYTAKLPE